MALSKEKPESVVDICNICQKEVNDKCKIDVCSDIFCFPCLYDGSKGKTRTFCPKCNTRYSLVRCRYSSEPGKKTTYDLIPIRAFRVYSNYLKESEQVEDDYAKGLLSPERYTLRRKLLAWVLDQLNGYWDELTEVQIDQLVNKCNIVLEYGARTTGASNRYFEKMVSDVSNSSDPSSSSESDQTDERLIQRQDTQTQDKSVTGSEFVRSDTAQFNAGQRLPGRPIHSSFGQPKSSQQTNSRPMDEPPVRPQPVGQRRVNLAPHEFSQVPSPRVPAPPKPYNYSNPPSGAQPPPLLNNWKQFVNCQRKTESNTYWRDRALPRDYRSLTEDIKQKVPNLMLRGLDRLRGLGTNKKLLATLTLFAYALYHFGVVEVVD